MPRVCRSGDKRPLRLPLSAVSIRGWVKRRILVMRYLQFMRYLQVLRYLSVECLITPFERQELL